MKFILYDICFFSATQEIFGPVCKYTVIANIENINQPNNRVGITTTMYADDAPSFDISTKDFYKLAYYKDEWWRIEQYYIAQSPEIRLDLTQLPYSIDWEQARQAAELYLGSYD